MRPNRFYDVIRIGPVKVGTYNNGRGQTRHAAACTAPGCGFSTDHRDRSAAELSARTTAAPPDRRKGLMLTPKYPPADTAPTAPALARTSDTAPPAPVAPAPVSNRPTVQLTPGSALALAAGGGAVVLVVGAVLVSMLLAVAITGVSVAVVAVVLRLLIKDLHKH